jgi:predicted esterase
MRTIAGVAAALLAVALGCEDAGSTTAGSSTASGGSDTSSSGQGAEAGSSSSGGGGAAPQNPEDVPAEPLGGDPALACPPAFQAAAPLAGENGDFEIAGQSRSFTLLEPPARFSGPRPMLIAFNGTGETGSSFLERADLETMTEQGFYVLAPWSAGNGALWPVWDAVHTQTSPDVDNKDLAYFDAIVACAGAHFPIDKNRLYVAGHSAGATMANYILQRRSELLAGGIVASGGFSFTAPMPKATLDGAFVLVTWGGDNDEYSGQAGEVFVDGINFIEQASLASIFYESEPNVAQANCRGNDVGHAWLELGDWFGVTLLEHPKGLAGKASLVLPALPATAPAACTTEPFVFSSGIEIVCGASTTAGCSETCQLFGDCLLENATLGPLVVSELIALGYGGTAEDPDCGGCLDNCESGAAGAANAAALDCMKAAQATAICGPGGEGGLPALEALDGCCAGQSDASWCIDTCTTFLGNSAIAQLLPGCAALVP